jgi:MFS transporter, DHA1 family, multidrug resistance protein
VLAAIACGSRLAMRMFVPARPAVARDLDTTPATAQLTLTAYLIGIAAGQFATGWLVVRRKRRRDPRHCRSSGAPHRATPYSSPCNSIRH